MITIDYWKSSTQNKLTLCVRIFQLPHVSKLRIVIGRRSFGMFTEILTIASNRVTCLAEHKSYIAFLIFATNILTFVHSFHITMVTEFSGFLSTFKCYIVKYFCFIALLFSRVILFGRVVSLCLRFGSFGIIRCSYGRQLDLSVHDVHLHGLAGCGRLYLILKTLLTICMWYLCFLGFRLGTS